MENILIFRCFSDVSIRSQKGSFHMEQLKVLIGLRLYCQCVLASFFEIRKHDVKISEKLCGSRQIRFFAIYFCVQGLQS